MPRANNTYYAPKARNGVMMDNLMSEVFVASAIVLSIVANVRLAKLDVNVVWISI